ncbi:similar to Saccharomyces cerevisiae YCR028C-A RIM1 Single-stranded DNA-binding protein essential for mitochondrial genome maintenance [Maudiozyma barnettii]|uniref:Single-stranded DNA-binding protein n=1 Tax=Maudiozyma barnettii TaxID=61262 RepID=A0A8H2VI08_9SACH|nr:Rim1p [Kazachstania barnettii]CAB4255920.1 similar to Saccharomyces cerevisiae YCR028C-A RIM1 Single-stranded DNA-binding protein essential for mitochondrial genome maintenance [Kazachstania barnettii]CAD1784480.1 similar to Saccharomyces cerevisiae YCR028C-A RIM1 Single-stranded DNA-binding protein essential for mitochondrial genome maintenance [Kazachstania barnettii]
MLQFRSFHASARKMDFSKLSIVGRIGTPFTEYTSAKDVKYVKYAVASQPRKDGPTNWYNVTVFNQPQMNFLQQYVRKGALVYIEADAANYTYEKEDGSKATVLSLIQKDFNLLRNGKPEEEADAGESAESTSE